MPQLAVLIGERRGWRTHRDADRQQRRWELNAWQLLDPMHVSRWSLLDHLDAVRVLGFDPIATGSAARQAA